MQHFPDPVRQIRRHRHAAAGIGRDFWFALAAFGDFDDGFPQAQEF